jgi:hypothetical protein
VRHHLGMAWGFLAKGLSKGIIEFVAGRAAAHEVAKFAQVARIALFFMIGFLVLLILSFLLLDVVLFLKILSVFGVLG